MQTPFLPYIPEDTIIDEDPFVQPATTGRIDGAIVSGEQAFANSPLAEGIKIVQAQQVNDFNPGPHVTQQEWKNGPDFRPGLSVPTTGINKNNAVINADRVDAENERQAVLNNMTPGFLSSGSRFIGTAIGFGLGNAPAVVLFPEISAVTEGLLGTNAAVGINALARLGGRAVGGAVAGAVTTAPDAFTRVAADNFFGQDTNIMSAMSEIGIGAAFGGVLHGAFGHTRLISNESNEVAKQLAVSQALESKFTNVMPVINNGYREAREGEAQQAAEVIPNADEADQAIAQAHQDSITNLEGQQEQLENQIPAARQKVDELSKKSLVKRSVPRGPTMIDNINAALKPIEGKRTTAQKSLLTNEKHLTEVHTVRNLREVPEADRSIDENDFINRFNNPIGEKAIVEERLQTARTNQQVFSRVPDADETQVSIDHRNTQLTQANHQVTMAENRLAELNKVPSFSAARKAANVKLFNLQDSRNKIVDQINERKLLLQMREHPPEAVTQSELRQASDEIASAEGDSAADPQAQARLDAQMETVEGPEVEVFNKQAEEAFNTVKDMQAAGQFTARDEQMFEVGKAVKSDSNILIKGIKKMSQCLIKDAK